ncbi:C40 family peptidase [Daejeonella oryzae]|uniref:C40 family peptidase n=1 Tax=Daejeonella oryzae TaxID=1122943 RepID=UPI000411ADB0|nr:NlpC/P60 family protein [Daejeonella oryzae]
MTQTQKLFLFLLLIFTGFTSCKSKKIISDSSTFKNKNLSGSLIQRYALVLNVDEKDIKNEKLYKFIDNWMGVPHQLAGSSKQGIDCSGFTGLLSKEIFNFSLPRTARDMADQVKRKYQKDLKEGDLVFFDFEGQKFSHVGVYLRNNKFVHVSTSKGVIISDLKDPWYYKYFSRAGSFIR